MNLKEMQRLSNALSEIRVKCPCSHTLFFPAYAPDIQICNHCGNKVYRNERVKFKDKCEGCGKFDFLKGHNGLCLCENCIKNYNPPIEKKPKKMKQLTIFDLEV